MKNKRFGAQLVWGLLLSAMTLGLTACDQIYNYSRYNYAGRPTPPSGLQQRVMAAYTVNGSSGGLSILDGLRDIRSNVENTITSYSIKGFGGADPIQIMNYPEQTTGYVLSYTDGNLIGVNYSTEASSGTVASFGAYPRSAAISPTATAVSGASEVNGILYVNSLPLNLPNVYKVATNTGGTVMLAMTRNPAPAANGSSNSMGLYRIVKLPTTANVTPALGAVDCEPLILPVYCVVPVTAPAGTFDHPYDAVFSTDGNSVYILNCGPECGGTKASVAVLQTAPLNVNTQPGVDPTAANAPSSLQTLPVANPIPIPGGVTAALSDGSTLYIAGQSTTDYTPNQVFSTAAAINGTQGQITGYFTGYLTTLNLSTYVASAQPISISDGTHTKLLFADNSTLWIGSQQCANGKRAGLATADLSSATGITDQNANYNCLTRVVLGAATPTASIVPAVVQSNTATTAPVTVAYPNTNLNNYYYGSLTGLCWVQGYAKVYTAYGDQIHLFATADGSEINNVNVTIQGTVLDVAYMDALTNSAN